jgi:hypothetical protein
MRCGVSNNTSRAPHLPNKRVKFARIARPTRKERCSLLAAYPQRSALNQSQGT